MDERFRWLFVLCALLLPACEGEGRLEGEGPRPVQGAAASIREFPDEINGFGTLSFLKKIDLGAPEDAVLASLHYREGDAVPRGAVVAELENPQVLLALGRAENAYTQAQAALDLARSRLLEAEFEGEARIRGLEKAEAELEEARRSYKEQRRKHLDQESLFSAGGISEEAIRNSRFSLESAAAQLGLMERELEIRRIGSRDQDLIAAGFSPSADGEEQLRNLILLATATLRAELQAAEARFEAAAKERESARIIAAELTLRSPASGIVGARYFEEGERVKREDKLLTLIDTGSLYAVFSVREAEVRRIEKGMPARVSLDGVEGVFPGTVDLVAPQADSQSFTFPVRVLLPPEALAAAGNSPPGGGELRPGMFARVSVSLGPPREALLIPESSLIGKRNQEARVFTVNGSTLAERRVSLGEALGPDREILAGLAPGEVVVLRPDSQLKEGLYVSLGD
jgi:RND family efflux transporter MFP subunit